VLAAIAFDSTIHVQVPHISSSNTWDQVNEYSKPTLLDMSIEVELGTRNMILRVGNDDDRKLGRVNTAAFIKLDGPLASNII